MSSSGTESSTSQSAPSRTEPTIYPPITHSISPTWFSWVKLTCYQIHNVLKPAPVNFPRQSYSFNPADQPPGLYHYINHPIQYVYVAGVVVEVNEYNEKYYIFVLDDSSGETLEVSYPRPPAVIQDNGDVGASVESRPAPPPRPPAQNQDSKEKLEEDQKLELLSSLAVGSVLKVKGHIITYHNCRRLRLDRVQLVSDTNEEAGFWKSMHEFNEKFLSKPWVLTEQDIAKAKLETQRRTRENEERVVRRRKRERLRAEYEEKSHLKLKKRWEKEEILRAREAEKARIAGEEVNKLIRKKNREKDAERERQKQAKQQKSNAVERQ